MRDDARGHWVDEVAGLARRWLGPGVLPEGPRPDEWWAALAARTAQAALAAHEGSADVARALAAAVGLGLDTGTESLPVLRHPTAVRSAEAGPRPQGGAGRRAFGVRLVTAARRS